MVNIFFNKIAYIAGRGENNFDSYLELCFYEIESIIKCNIEFTHSAIVEWNYIAASNGYKI